MNRDAANLEVHATAPLSGHCGLLAIRGKFRIRPGGGDTSEQARRVATFETIADCRASVERNKWPYLCRYIFFSHIFFRDKFKEGP
jgi:hypothetical protein